MGFPAKDGSMHGMKSRAMAHNRHADAKSRMGGETKAPNAIMDAPGGEDDAGQDTMEDPHDVVEAHGTAHEVNVKHPEGEGESEVHSMHPDGHETHSKHHSKKEAMDHAACLSGDCEHDGGSEVPMGDDAADDEGGEY